MAGYNFLLRIADANARNAIKALTDRINMLETQAASIGQVTDALTDDLDAGSHRVKKVANPTADTDAVNYITLKRYVDARLNQAGLTDAGGQTAAAVDTDDGQTAAGVTAGIAAGSDGHPDIPGGQLTAYNVGLILAGVGHEFPALVAAAPDQATRDSRQAELLSRIIWHLQIYGFTAGKQRNPSGIVSGDKIAVIQDGQLRAFDIFTSPSYSAAITIQAIQVTPPSLVSDSGTAD